VKLLPDKQSDRQGRAKYNVHVGGNYLMSPTHQAC